MERAGTGGCLFRNLYRDFLKESYSLTKNSVFKRGYDDFCKIVTHWSKIILLFEKIGETEDRKHVNAAASLFKTLSVAEQQAMERLAKI